MPSNWSQCSSLHFPASVHRCFVLEVGDLFSWDSCTHGLLQILQIGCAKPFLDVQSRLKHWHWRSRHPLFMLCPYSSFYLSHAKQVYLPTSDCISLKNFITNLSYAALILAPVWTVLSVCPLTTEQTETTTTSGGQRADTGQAGIRQSQVRMIKTSLNDAGAPLKLRGKKA